MSEVEQLAQVVIKPVTVKRTERGWAGHFCWCYV